MYLKAEISNFKAHTRGHLYFTLKDEGSRINAVMFESMARGLSFVPEDGMFYSSDVVTWEDMPDSTWSNISEGKTIV